MARVRFARNFRASTYAFGALGVVATYIIFQWTQAVRWGHALEYARAQGFAVSLQDYQRKPVYPDAAPYYRVVDGWMVHQRRTRREPNRFRAPMFEAEWRETNEAKIRASLAVFEPIRPEIERIASIDECIFPRDYREGYFMLFPEYATVRLLSRVKQLDAQLAIIRGDRKSAVNHLVGAIRIGRHAGSDRCSIGTAIRAQVESDVMTQAESLKPNPQEAKALLTALGPLPNAREEIGRNVGTYRYSRAMLSGADSRAQAFADVGLKVDDLRWAPIQDALYELGITRGAIDVEFLQALIQGAAGLPEYPTRREDFASYDRMCEIARSNWNPLRDAFEVEKKIADYPEHYMMMRQHRDTLANRQTAPRTVAARRTRPFPD
jgi:hypothetical protein